MSPWATVRRSWRAASRAGFRTKAVTWWPRSRACSTSARPVPPVAPMIKTRTRTLSGFSQSEGSVQRRRSVQIPLREQLFAGVCDLLVRAVTERVGQRAAQNLGVQVVHDNQRLVVSGRRKRGGEPVDLATLYPSTGKQS